MAQPKYLGKVKPTKHLSNRQEKNLSKEFGGRPFAGSGATFGENDIKTPIFEIEAKATEKKQYTLKADTIKLLSNKCRFEKVPLLVVDFLKDDEELIIIRKTDFFQLLGYQPTE